MLELWVGTGLDDGMGWRNLLGPGEARAGWDCVGPAGLVRRLGVLLGVDTQTAARGLRIGAMDARLTALDDGAKHYSRSREADPTGVAAHLLERCDELRLAGWDGRALTGSPRLEELSNAGAEGPGTPNGPAQAALCVLAALEKVSTLPVPLRLALASPLEHFAPLHARILKRLAALGAEVVDAELAPVAVDPGSDDLRTVQAALGSEVKGTRPLLGDGSVWLLEAETPWEAADLLAHYLADHPEPRRTLLVPREGALLDAVLRRRGLPALGISTPSRWRPALQVLPLRLALLFWPRDPGRALELLSLPVAPLPWALRRKLMDALHEMPGVDGPLWRAAVEEAAQEAALNAPNEDAEEAARKVRESVERWFGGGGHRAEEGAPLAEVVAVCRSVAQWAQARALSSAGEGEAEAASFHEAASVARSLETMLGHLQAGAKVPRLQLEQLHDLALGSGAAGEGVEAGSGRPAVCSQPEAVLPADEVVWWGFDEQGAVAGAPSAATAWTEEEAHALRAQGVEVEPHGSLRARERAGWHRVVRAARKRLVLVRIRSAGGETLPAHPLEDELVARLPEGALAKVTVTARQATSGAMVALGEGWAPRTEEVPSAPDVVPRPVWRLPAEHLRPRPPLSPTAVERFLGCPLRWALQGAAGLRPGALGGMQEVSRIVGNFAHRLLQDLFFGEDAPALATLTPQGASEWAAQAFDARVEGEAAPLLRPGHEAQRRSAREQIARAAGSLVALLQEGGWTPVAAEQEVDAEFAGVPLTGRVDLVLERGGKKAVLDLNLGNPANRRRELREGRALQLSLYSRALAKGGGAWPPTAYMMVGDARVMTTDAAFGQRSEVVTGPSSRETVLEAEALWGWWRNVVEAGQVPARHPDLLDEAQQAAQALAGPPPSDNPFTGMEAPCRFCDFQAMCTARIERAEEVA